MWEMRKKIIDEYNAKAIEFNESLYTPKEIERNKNWGNRIADDETRSEFASRVRKWHEALIILPNPNEP